MAQIDFSAAYRDSTRGSTLKAMQQRRIELAKQTEQAMQPQQISSPWQGAAGIADVVGSTIREARAASQETAGRQQFAKLLAGGLTPDEIGQAMVLDPETTMKYQEHTWDTEAKKAEQDALNVRELQKHGWDVDAATARVNAERDAATQAQKATSDLSTQQAGQASTLETQKAGEQATAATVAADRTKAQAEQTAALSTEEGKIAAELKAGIITPERAAERQKQVDDLRASEVAKNQPEIFTDLTAEQKAALHIPEGISAQRSNKTNELKIGTYPQQTAAENAGDIATSKEITDWTTGGKAMLATNLQNVGEAIKSLQGGSMLGKTGEALGLGQTGPVAGMMPDVVHSFFNPDMLKARDAIRSAVGSSLVATLGGQFAEREGQQLMDRAFSMGQRPEENVRRARLIMEQLSQIATVKDAMAEWSRTHNGMMKGFVPPPIDIEGIKKNLASMFTGEGGDGAGAPAAPAPADTGGWTVTKKGG